MNTTNHCCDLMTYLLNEEKVCIGYLPQYREYYIELRNNSAKQRMIYCPWCNIKLPESLKDMYFSILEKEYNIDHPRKQEELIPKEFTTDVWWKKRKL